MSDTVHGPWEQAENSDYDEQKPGSADSHEDEYDDEYGVQQPKGDPNQPDNKLEDAHQADIDYWEEIARLNAMAKPYDPDAPVTADPPALPYDPDAAVIVDPPARTYDPDAPVTAQPSSLDPYDTYQPVIIDPGPRGDEGTASDPSFDAFGDGSAVSSSQTGSADPFEDGEPYQAGGPSFEPDVEVRPDVLEQTDWNDFIG